MLLEEKILGTISTQNSNFKGYVKKFPNKKVVIVQKYAQKHCFRGQFDEYHVLKRISHNLKVDFTCDGDDL